jgi:hypothetical protein
LEQCKPWIDLINDTIQNIVRAVYGMVQSALAPIADPSTLDGLWGQFIFPRLESLRMEMGEKIKELLEPHITGHPITYNHYLTENVQKAQNARRTQELEKSLAQFLGVGAEYIYRQGVVTVNINNLISRLVTDTEPDMNIYASSTATDFMEAYYKVCISRSLYLCLLSVLGCIEESHRRYQRPCD